jgi:hypothetical protein
MREIRTSGSEGGGAEPNRPSLPLTKYPRLGPPAGPLAPPILQNAVPPVGEIPLSVGRNDRALENLMSRVNIEPGVAAVSWEKMR